MSVSSSGTQAAALIDGVAISADARFVVFESTTDDLVPGDTNGVRDVFLRDRTAFATIRCSVDSFGAQGNGESKSASVSGDGRFVAFASYAANLVSGDTNGFPDVFVRDNLSGITLRASVPSSGSEADDGSYGPSISATGRYIAYSSAATNLVSGDTNGVEDIFVHDTQLATTIRVSASSTAIQADAGSHNPQISSDGRFVVFDSFATNLVAGDTNASRDVFLHDTLQGTTVRVSVDSLGAQASGESRNSTISGDGLHVAFYSPASNLVAGDTNSTWDAFVHERLTGLTTRVSVGPNGLQANHSSGGGPSEPALSFDGRYVVFDSWAHNLVPADGSGEDVFVHDRTSGTTTRVSVSTSGIESNGYSSSPAISADGHAIAFLSSASNLVQGDTNSVTDAFVRVPYPKRWRDADQDAYGDAELFVYELLPVPGYVDNATDCDDSNPTIHPLAAEVCNGIDEDCDGLIDEGFLSTYCTAGTTVHGCVPSIAGIGAPSSIAPTGFDIVVSQLDGQRFGAIFYGFYPAAIQWAPFSPSFKCVASPVTRTGVVSSGGTSGQCNGELRVDFNAWMRANPGAIGSPFVAGQVFHAQGWLRDPGAPKQTNLSNGLRFTLCD